MLRLRIPEMRPWRRWNVSDQNAETIELLLTWILIMAVGLWFVVGR